MYIVGYTCTCTYIYRWIYIYILYICIIYKPVMKWTCLVSPFIRVFRILSFYSLPKFQTGKTPNFTSNWIIFPAFQSLLDYKRVLRLKSILNLINSKEESFYLKMINILLKVLPMPYIKM